MKYRLLSAGLLFTSLFGYLEWGNDQHSFLFQVEYDLFFGSSQGADSFQHPFVFLPLLGQLLLLIAIFQNTPARLLVLSGMACISVLMLMIFIVGILSFNVAIAGSSLPFLFLAVFVMRTKWRRKK
jgi:hypothetical protein